MSEKKHGRFAGLLLAALFLALWTDTATAQDPPKLRYGFHKNDPLAYEVKIVAQLPDEEVTHQGVLTYTVLSVSDDQFAMNYMGSLIKSVKAEPGSARSGPFGPRGFGGPPRIPAPPHFGGPPGFGPMSPSGRPDETTFSRSGKIIIFGDSHSLPCMLGDEGELVIETLPEEAKSNWSKETDLGVIERDESGPFPFARPFGPGASSETSRGAKERIDYAIVETKDVSVRISKKYSLKTAEEGGKHHIDMSGSGEFEFDYIHGIIKSQMMKYEIRINEKNVLVTIPVTLTYRLLSEGDLADLEKNNEAAAAAELKKHADAAKEGRNGAKNPRVLAPAMQEHLLKQLRSGEERRISTAAKVLARYDAGNERTEVARALCEAFKKAGDSVKADILDALAVWHVPEAEKTLIEASRSGNQSVREKATALLGKFETPAAAKAVADGKKNDEKPAEDSNPAAPEPPKSRTWRDVSGTYELEATFVKSEANKVTLKKTNGKTITLPLAKLSKADRDYVERLLKSQAEKPENPFE